jgi:hypothetical protein
LSSLGVHVAVAVVEVDDLTRAETGKAARFTVEPR